MSLEFLAEVAAPLAVPYSLVLLCIIGIAISLYRSYKNDD